MIGLPPIWNYGSPELQAKIVPEVLSGKKFIALAITEAFAGSDVSGLQTTAVRDGDEWVITGTKKCGPSFSLAQMLIICSQMDHKWNFCGLFHNRMSNRGVSCLYE